jgi:hypothetical protein
MINDTPSFHQLHYQFDYISYFLCERTITFIGSKMWRLLLLTFVCSTFTLGHSRWEQFYTPDREIHELEGMCLKEFANRLVFWALFCLVLEFTGCCSFFKFKAIYCFLIF